MASQSTDEYRYFVKIVSRKNHRDGAVDLGVNIVSSYDHGMACWRNVEPKLEDSAHNSSKMIARLRKNVTIYSIQTANVSWGDFNDSEEQGEQQQLIIKLMVTAGAFAIISCPETLGQHPHNAVSRLCLVSISPTIPILQKLLEHSDKLSMHAVTALITPNPLNFRKSIRSAPPSLTPRPPSNEPLFPLRTTRKQHLALMLGGSHRIRVKPPKATLMETLNEEYSATKPRTVKPLGLVMAIPCDAPVNFENALPTAPSARGPQTRHQYMYEKKLPQIYSLLSLIVPLLGDKAVRILDVGGGRGDLAHNILWYAETFLDRWTDEVVIVDQNPDCPLPRHKRISLVSGDFTTFEFEVKFDITLALHACGNLTDIILKQATALTKKAVIVVPCCYGKITPHHALNLLSERNQQPEVCEKAMSVVNEHRLRHLDRIEDWNWEMYMFPRSYSSKNLVLLGARNEAE